MITLFIPPIFLPTSSQIYPFLLFFNFIVLFFSTSCYSVYICIYSSSICGPKYNCLYKVTCICIFRDGHLFPRICLLSYLHIFLVAYSPLCRLSAQQVFSIYFGSYVVKILYVLLLILLVDTISQKLTVLWFLYSFCPLFCNAF